MQSNKELRNQFTYGQLIYDKGSKSIQWEKTALIISGVGKTGHVKKKTRIFSHSIHTNNSKWIPFSSVAQSCLTICDPMNLSVPGLPVHHQLPESTQTHVHRVGDAIQLSQPVSSASPPALNLSQHQGLLK